MQRKTNFSVNGTISIHGPKLVWQLSVPIENGPYFWVNGDDGGMTCTLWPLSQRICSCDSSQTWIGRDIDVPQWRRQVWIEVCISTPTDISTPSGHERRIDVRRWMRLGIAATPAGVKIAGAKAVSTNVHRQGLSCHLVCRKGLLHLRCQALQVPNVSPWQACVGCRKRT